MELRSPHRVKYFRQSLNAAGEYEGAGASAARNRINTMKANMDANGNSHLGNSGEGEKYNPTMATDKKSLEELAKQPNSIAALAEHAQKQVNSGDPGKVTAAVKIRTELDRISRDPSASGVAKEQAARGRDAIDNTTISTIPGLIGPIPPQQFANYLATDSAGQSYDVAGQSAARTNIGETKIV